MAPNKKRNARRNACLDRLLHLKKLNNVFEIFCHHQENKKKQFEIEGTWDK